MTLLTPGITLRRLEAVLQPKVDRENQHMRTLRTLLFCALMLTGSAAIAHQIRTDWDRGAKFYEYRTFMWAKEPELENPWMNEQIINAVTAELETRGLCLVTSCADLAV